MDRCRNLKTMTVAVAWLLTAACSEEVPGDSEPQKMALEAEVGDVVDSLPPSMTPPGVLMAKRLRDLNSIQRAGSEAVLGNAGEAAVAELFMMAEAMGQPLDTVGVGFDRRGNVRYLNGGPLGLFVELSGSTTAERAQSFLGSWSELYQSKELQLEVASVEDENSGTVRLRQIASGYTVFGSGVVVQVDPMTSRIKSIAGVILPDAVVPSTPPVLMAGEALDLATSWGLLPASEDAELGIADPLVLTGQLGNPELAWRIQAAGEDGLPYLSYVSAHTGEEVVRIKQVNEAEEKNVYYISQYLCGPTDCVCSQLTQGTSEEVCELGSDIWQYYDDAFGRDGWDDDPLSQDHDITLLSDNYSSAYGAAWLWGMQAIQFGSEALCTDVMGHEFTHAIVDDELEMEESNYIDEGLADIMGEFFSQYMGTTDWAMYTGSPSCDYPIRNLASPGSWTDPLDGVAYPDHWSNCWMEATRPSHHNATILGKTAHLLGRPSAEGSTTHWGRTVQGVGRATAEQIYYHSITDFLSASADLTEVRMSAIDAAEAEFPGNTTVIQATKASMDAVGIWTPDYDFGINSDTAVRSTTFSVSGIQRRYYLWKLAGATDLKLRYNTCEACEPNCRNNVTTTIGDTTNSPGLASVGRKLHFVWKDRTSSAIKWRYVDDYGAMSSTTTLAYTTDSDIDAARVGTRFFVFWKPVGSGEQLLAGAYWYNSQWTSLGTLPAGTVSAHGPAVTGDSSGNLWLVYVKSVGGEDRVVARKRSSGGSWGSEIVFSGSLATQQPTAEYYRDRVHIAAENMVDSAYDIGYTSCEMPCSSGSDFTRWVIQDGGAAHHVSLTAGNDSDSPLFMMYRPITQATDIYCRSKNSE